MRQPTDLISILDCINHSIACLEEADLYYGHGTDNAHDEAVALVLGTIVAPHHVSDDYLVSPVTTDQRDAILKNLDLRIYQKIPVPYLTHEAWFAGFDFYVNEHVLIPRSPTAELIENHFAPWIDGNKVKRILDLCTGSGCIAIVCAKYFPDAQVDASDISAEALKVAKINVAKHKVAVHLIQSDLFNDIPAKKYDVIISNPPYVDEEDMQSLPNEYLHEPELALAAGKDGLYFAEIIMAKAKEYLTDDGILIVEVGNNEFALVDQYPHIPFMWLEFERGGGGVFLLTAKDLQKL